LTAILEVGVATITVRNLSPTTQRKIKQRAAANNRSMEAEARAILTAAVGDDGFGPAWLAMAAGAGGVELDLPGRSMPRDADVS
jgi:plasmid stability protein